MQKKSNRKEVEIICRVCRGEGKVFDDTAVGSGYEGDLIGVEVSKSCHKCKGTGKETIITEVIKKDIVSLCYRCDNTGKQMGKTCPGCYGTGFYMSQMYYHIVDGICIGGDTLK